MAAVRTVVFRGFGGDNDDPRLRVSTDCRSEKVAELGDNDRAELCWYFSDTREQAGQICVLFLIFCLGVACLPMPLSSYPFLCNICGCR